MKIRAFDTIFFIFLLVLIFRLFFALQTPNFSEDNAYYNTRQIDNIAETGKHIAYDELSYGGRQVLGAPLALYAYSFFKAIFGKHALKILPAFFMALLVFVVYLIANKISGNHTAAALATLGASFVPIVVFKTLNNISEYAVVYPLLFLLIYAFYNLENKRYLWLFIALTFLLPAMHPISILFAISLVIFLVLAYIEEIEIDSIRTESILLFVLIAFLISLVMYRLAFANIGLGVIWQNTPESILSEYFKGIGIIDVIINVGLVPLLFGVAGIYFTIRNKNKDIMLLLSICITSIVLLAAKLIAFSTGLMILGITLSIISAVGFDKFLKYVNVTKLAAHIKNIKVSLVLFIILTLMVPSLLGAQAIIDSTYKNEDIVPFLWMNENTALSATILADVNEGNLITQIAKRKSVVDTNFLFVKNINKRLDEAISLFSLESEVKALELIKRYDIDYIYLSEKSKEKYDIKKLKYSVNEMCFEKVFENESGEIIKIIC